MFLKNKNAIPYKKILIRPFVYKHNSIGEESIKILVLLGIQLVLLAVSGSISALTVILAAVLGSAAAEIIAVKGYSQRIHFSGLMSIIQGIIVGMLLPETYPPLTVFFVTLCTMLIVKYLFGGFAYAWVNPSVVAVAVMWFVGAKIFPAFAVSMDMLSMRNPSQLLIENGFFPLMNFDAAVTEALNNTVFSLFKVSIPEGYVSILWDTHSVIPAFRYNLVSLISSIVLFCDDSVKLIVPACFIFVYLMLVRMLAPIFCGGILYQGDMLLAIFTGGTLFCASFVMGWYGTTPLSVTGKIIYGVFGGTVAFFIAGCGTSPAGMPFTVLIMNIASPLIQQWETEKDRRNLKKMLGESREGR